MSLKNSKVREIFGTINKQILDITFCDRFEFKNQQNEKIETKTHHTNSNLNSLQNSNENLKEKLAMDSPKKDLGKNTVRTIRNGLKYTSNMSNVSINHSNSMKFNDMNNKYVNNLDNKSANLKNTSTNCLDISKEQTNSNEQSNKNVNLKRVYAVSNINEIMNLNKQGNNFNYSTNPKNNCLNQLPMNEVDIKYLYKMINKNNEISFAINDELNDMKNEKVDSNQTSNNFKNSITEPNRSGNDSHNNPQGQLTSQKIPKFYSNNIYNVNSSSESNLLSGQNNNGNSQPYNSDSFNSSNSNNLNNTKFFNKYNARKQLDDSKISSLKFNLQNKNKEHDANNNNVIDNLANINTEYIQNYLNSNNVNLDDSQFNCVDNKDKKRTLDQSKLYKDTENKDNDINPQLKSNINIENIFLKNFINNKVNGILSGENQNAKMLLYLLLLANNNDNNFSQNNLLNMLFPLNYQYGSMQKQFQKEIVKYTIENFCKYLKKNGFSIVKSKPINNDVIDNADKESPIADKSNDSFESSLSIVQKLNCDKQKYSEKIANGCNNKVSNKKKALLCTHTNKVHYARGKCRNCYLKSYRKDNRNSTKIIKENDSNIIEFNNSVKNEENNMNDDFTFKKNKTINRKRKREIEQNN